MHVGVQCTFARMATAGNAASIPHLETTKHTCLACISMARSSGCTTVLSAVWIAQYDAKAPLRISVHALPSALRQEPYWSATNTLQTSRHGDRSAHKQVTAVRARGLSASQALLPASSLLGRCLVMSF
jgi:hypothetical protein